jgi:hypothetical protein
MLFDKIHTMKTKSIIVIVLFLCISVSFLDLNAQELQKPPRISKYDGLNQDQLNVALTQSLKTKKTGKTLTVIGIGAGTLGGILIATSFHADTWDKGLSTATTGALFFEAGLLSAGIGVPLWIVGASNKNKIEIKLAKFGPTSYANGIGVRITF